VQLTCVLLAVKGSGACLPAHLAFPDPNTAKNFKDRMNSFLIYYPANKASISVSKLSISSSLL